jgi:hypothetical protein
MQPWSEDHQPDHSWKLYQYPGATHCWWPVQYYRRFHYSLLTGENCVESSHGAKKEASRRLRLYIWLVVSSFPSVKLVRDSRLTLTACMALLYSV